MLCPVELKLKTFGDIKDSRDFRDKLLPAKDKEYDDPMIREIRRRIIDIIEDIAELGYI